MIQFTLSNEFRKCKFKIFFNLLSLNTPIILPSECFIYTHMAIEMQYQIGKLTADTIHKIAHNLRTT